MSNGSSSPVVPILMLALLLGYVWLCGLVGQAAARKGRSLMAWTLISMAFGLVLPAVVVAAMAAPTGQLPQGEGGALPAGDGDVLVNLARLSELRAAGLLTEGEFAAKKRALIDRC